ncbi:Uncharacterised protein [Chlamydia trachomatis]|nr:Uncharacterised protein [Chlamydia trachomatis]
MSELMVVSGFNPGEKKDLLTIIILTNRKIVIYNTNQKSSVHTRYYHKYAKSTTID